VCCVKGVGEKGAASAQCVRKAGSWSYVILPMAQQVTRCTNYPCVRPCYLPSEQMPPLRPTDIPRDRYAVAIAGGAVQAGVRAKTAWKGW